MFCVCCGARINDNATQCPSCGEGVKRPPTVCLVEEKQRGGCRGCLACLFAFFGLCVLFFGLVTFVGCPVADDEKEIAAESQKISEEEAVSNAEALIAWIRACGEQTRLVRDEAFSKLKGKTILVTGEVHQVGKTVFSDKVYVSLTVGKKNAFERVNIQFNIQESCVKQVSTWNLGETHTLRGVIKGQGDLEDDAVCDHSIVVK